MSKASKTMKSGRVSIKQIDINPAMVNAWLAKNKTNPLSEKERIASISDCPAPWG